MDLGFILLVLNSALAMSGPFIVFSRHLQSQCTEVRHKRTIDSLLVECLCSWLGIFSSL